MTEPEEFTPEPGVTAEHYCMYHRQNGKHWFSVNGKCYGCGKKEGK